MIVEYYPEVKFYRYAQMGGEVPDELAQKFKDGTSIDDGFARYEYDEGYDMFFLNVPEDLRDMSEGGFSSLGFCISAANVICVYDYWDDSFPDIMPSLVSHGMSKRFSGKKTALSIIDHVTKDDGRILGKLEDCIAALEDKVLRAKAGEVSKIIKEIISVKQTLHPLKQLYEQLIDALEDMIEDENDIYNESEIKYCKRIYNRVERLYKTVLNLRDYITQTREAYQSQIDISVNNIMKTFTVITAIFLPLTFIAGWYGMNFEYMPEFSWKYGYIAVISISLVVAAGCFILFKRRKWF